MHRLLERLKALAEARGTRGVSKSESTRTSGLCKSVSLGKRRRDYQSGPKHSFETDKDDHCETSGDAYDDISAFLCRVASNIGKLPKDLAIYDPYYCNGAVVRHLASRGFHNVHNRNEDFYRVIAEGRVPDYDICVTNPPYSGDHIERMLKFCVESNKPFFCLVPNYVYTKPYFNVLTASCRPFYLIPENRRYEFWTPGGFRKQSDREKKTSPFISFWYCHAAEGTADLVKWWRKRKSDDVAAKKTILVQNLRLLPQRVKATFDKNRKRLRKKQRISIKLKSSKPNSSKTTT